MDKLNSRIFNLKMMGKYLTDSELRKAYGKYKESEEMAMRLIVNSLLGAGWLVTLSKPTMIEDLAKEYGYTNMSLLKNVLTLLETQNIVERVGDEYSIKEIVTSPIRPSDIGTVLANFYYDCAQFIPDALRGKAVPIQDVPRVVLETVFGSTLTEIGRGVLLRSFSGKETKDVAIAAFADVGIPFILQQINDILKPERIRLFLNDYRMVSPLTSMMGLLSDGDVRRKISTHLLGIETDWDVDLFYGEEFFAYNQNEIDAKVEMISKKLKPSGRLVTNDPTIDPEDTSITPAYVLMQTIEGYPQPIPRDVLIQAFKRHSLNTLAIGGNWVIAEKMGNTI